MWMAGFAGAVAQFTVGVCGNVDGRFYSAWWCKQNNTARAIVTAILPSILLTVWQTIVMPMVLYRCALRLHCTALEITYQVCCLYDKFFPCLYCCTCGLLHCIAQV